MAYGNEMHVAEKILRGSAKKRDNTKKNYEDKRALWRAKGPAWFGENELQCPPNVPVDPKTGKLPNHIILSEDQKELLELLWLFNIQAIVSAGRGAGKTFTIAVYTTWRIVCYDWWDMTVMGGSQTQSKIVQGYIDYWRVVNKDIKYCIPKSVAGAGGNVPYVNSRWGAVCRFPPCSESAARGEHVRDLLLDEVCLHPDTMLYTDYGITKKAKDIVNEELFSDDGEFHKITKTFVRHINEDIIELIPYYYSIGIKLTKNHPVLSYKRSNPYFYKKENRYMPEKINKNNLELNWHKVEELKENDLVAFPIPKIKYNNIEIIDISKYLKKENKNNIKNLIINEDFCELLGWYIAEGSTNVDRVFFSLKIGEEQHIIELIKKVFNKTPQLHYFRDCNCVNVFFSSRALVKWLEENCGKKAPNKHIPYILFNLPKQKMDKILLGIFNGDACIKSYNIRLHTTSYELGTQITFINASNGIFTSIQKNQTGYEFTIYNKKRYGFIYNNMMIIPIRKINNFNYKGNVYNFEVDSTNTYCTPFTILHNCVAESKSEEGRKAVRSATWQTTGTVDFRFVMTSTAQYILGTFYETWRNYKQLRFKRLRWAIARHVSPKWFGADGKPDWDYIDAVLYKDRNPNNWIPNVWWMSEDGIHKMRLKASNDEWLVEALGGISIGYGLVFRREDLDTCICRGVDGKECEVCEPWTRNCPLMKKFDLDDNLSKVTERRAGADFGTNSPNALTILGKLGDCILVLYSDEMVGLSDTDVLLWIHGLCQKWKVWDIFADPEQRGMIQGLENYGYALPQIWAEGSGMKKNKYVTNEKRWIEAHKVIIPKAFIKLIDSLVGLSYDDTGKVRKYNDHSFDSKMYAMSEFDIDSGIDEFWKIKDKSLNIWKINT